MQSFDVVIVGAGMTGLTLALALKSSGLSVAVIDPSQGERPVGDEPELRVSAISLASQRVFENVGVWQSISKQRHQAYTHMSVWDQDSFASIHFDHNQVQQAQLGFIIENQIIVNSLWQQAEQADHISLLSERSISKLDFGQQESFIRLDDDSMLSARLVVGADGANSMVRQQADLPQTFWDYEHTAIVATIKTQEPHQQCARQVFTPSGPLAFLPLSDPHLCSIVWSQDTAQAQELLSIDNESFSHAIYVAFDGKLGQCQLVSQRQSFPLRMRYARQWVKDRVALVGDAAHTIHPLARQGANLGLLDAAALAEHVTALHKQGKDFGLKRYLRPYERWRKSDASKMIGAMEGFKRLFEGAHPLKKLLRGVGLAGVERAPMLKQSLIQQAMGIDVSDTGN